MKKLSSFKRLCVVSAAALILVMCAFFNIGYIGGADANAEMTVGLYAEAATSALDVRKSEVKAELKAIVDNAKAVAPSIDWTSLDTILDGYNGQIDAVDATGGIPRVNQIYDAASLELNSKVYLEKYRAVALLGNRLDYPGGYLGQKYNLVKIYYQDQIRTAISVAQIDGYVDDAHEKYDVITDFEELRNGALDTISERQPEPAALASYVTLIDGIKSTYSARIENDITGEPAASAELNSFRAGYEALEPQIIAVLSDFDTAFNTLIAQLATHSALVDAALTTERAVEIVTQVFARAQIQPYTLGESIQSALSGMGYTQSVAASAVVIIDAHHAALENLRAVATTEKLASGQADITALENTLKTDLQALKATALAEEDAIAKNMDEAERVDNLIKGLSANSSWDEIKAVREEYNKLSKAQKGYVTQLAKLEELESLKETESPLIGWGIALIIVTVLFLGLLSAFLVIVAKRKKNVKIN